MDAGIYYEVIRIDSKKYLFNVKKRELLNITKAKATLKGGIVRNLSKENSAFFKTKKEVNEYCKKTIKAENEANLNYIQILKDRIKQRKSKILFK